MYTVGTAYFPSEVKAILYYGSREAVVHKIIEGEIHIGKPKLKEGETLVLLDNNIRYGIQTKEL